MGKSEIPTLKQSTAGAAAYQKGESLVPVFDLGVQPLANDFCADGEERAGWAPLKVLHCPQCWLGQLSVTVNPEVLYRRYFYVTSPGSTMHAHFETLAGDIKEEVGVDCPSIIEIGSNDGRLLRQFKGHGFEPSCGIDPADNLSSIARAEGTATITGMFNQETAKAALEVVGGRVDVVLARHVFCHVDDWKGFIETIRRLLDGNSIACVEVPYAQDLLDKCEFDTIYHEHTSYLSIRSIVALLKDTSLYLHRIIRYAIHGGALLLIIRPKDYTRTAHTSVENFIDSEDLSPEHWKKFAVEAGKRVDTLAAYVRKLKLDGKSVAALGASAKSTVWLNAMHFTRKEVSWIADSTSWKLYRTSPDSGIPIVDEGAILRELPDYLLCFAWNFLPEIIAKNQMYLEKGGKIIVPVPNLQIISQNGTTEL